MTAPTSVKYGIYILQCRVLGNQFAEGHNHFITSIYDNMIIPKAEILVRAGSDRTNQVTYMIHG